MRFFVIRHAGVDHLGIVLAGDALADFEEELSLGGMIHRYPRPFGHSVLIIYKGSRVDMLEFLGDGRTLDYFLQAGGVDVVLHPHSLLPAVLVHQREPFLHSLEEFDMLAELLELAAPERDTRLAGLVEHQLHVCQHVAGILPDGDSVAHLPEFFLGLADRLDEPEFLHVARRQSAVEVVYQCCYGSFCHNSFTPYNPISPQIYAKFTT